VCVDDAFQFDPLRNSLLQSRNDSAERQYSHILSVRLGDILGRVCRVDNNTVLGFVVSNEVGIVVAFSLPYI